jgi:hypothetical protein
MRWQQNVDIDMLSTHRIQELLPVCNGSTLHIVCVIVSSHTAAIVVPSHAQGGGRFRGHIA